MKSKSIIFLSLMLLVSLVVTGCSQSAAAASNSQEATLIPTVVADVHIVAEGRLVPYDNAQLAFFSSGQVSEVFVEEGNLVERGQVLARLGDTQQIQASIAAAKAEQVVIQQSMDELHENLDIARVEIARMISAANRQLRDAQYQFDNYTVPSDQAEMSAMQAVAAMKDKLDLARREFEAYKFLSSNNPTREQLKEDLDAAQSSYNAAVRRLELETDLMDTQARLDQAVRDYQILEKGPNPDQVATLQAQLDAAQASILAGEAALSNLELVATIDGSVVQMDLMVGQSVSAGQVVITLADLSQMFVETDDLTEIEVVGVSLGQRVSISADALPELELNGEVLKISDVYEVKRGDVTYTVRILLDEFDPRLRWGMTVVVTFEE